MDKFLHCFICLALSLYSTELAIGAALTKEYCDKVYSQGTNHFCFYDLLCDIIGIAFGTMLRILLIDRYNWF